MGDFYIVYIESLDQDLRVFESEQEAETHYNQMLAAGKSAKMMKFSDYMVTDVERSNGNFPDEPTYWEELRYQNEGCTLVARYTWHEPPEKEGYYADYVLEV